MPNSASPGSLRDRQKQQTRALIIDAAMEAMADGRIEGTTHDALGKAIGVSRMTVYRYFPDREALEQAVWQRVTELAGPNVGFPRTEEDLVATMPDIYEGFDRIAPLATLLRATPAGRAVRLSQRKQRTESYTAALAGAVRDLPQGDRVLATAVLQLLHTTAWLEMRDQWQLDGASIAKACAWATRTLLADLRSRGSRPLDEP